ncbi:MAG: hypothetical protein JOY89_04245 [Solirubrobacterales bacterium]|nr:hypothetical protein [Solirubrobacterales bacterium]
MRSVTAPPWQIAGLATDLIGYSLWLAPILFGTVTLSRRWQGTRSAALGPVHTPHPPDLMTGIAFVAVAAFVAVGTGG